MIGEGNDREGKLGKLCRKRKSDRGYFNLKASLALISPLRKKDSITILTKANGEGGRHRAWSQFGKLWESRDGATCRFRPATWNEFQSSDNRNVGERDDYRSVVSTAYFETRKWTC